MLKLISVIMILQMGGWSVQANELKLHVIEPRLRIKWSSPRMLAITSGLDSIGKDYAPIGHFAVEIKCSRPNHYGISHVLTGMEREDKVESRRITLKKKLGLGSLIYPFKGALQGAVTSQEEINRAAKDRRLKTITIPTSQERCEAMLDFIDEWIESGSYLVYGGGKDTAAGEGAGCADFAMELFRIATQMPEPDAWNVKLKVPTKLMGDGHEQRVPFTRLLFRSKWAKPGESYIDYQIADTNKVSDWLREHSGRRTVEHLFSAHLAGGSADELSPPAARAPFRFAYETLETPLEKWQSINASSTSGKQ